MYYVYLSAAACDLLYSLPTTRASTVYFIAIKSGKLTREGSQGRPSTPTEKSWCVAGTCS